MRRLRTLFLEQFDSSIQPHIIEFGKQISKIDVDVYMLMARKAACFVDCLEMLGLAQLRGLVITDRLLDMDLGWLRNKRVALIDDALISGTTIYRTVEKLRSAGTARIVIHPFCVNTEWWSRDLARPTEPYLELTDHQTTSFCAGIVDALSVFPRPYGVDYPLVQNIRVPISLKEDLITLNGWETFDLSSSLQKSHNILALTSIPDRSILKRLDDSLGWELSAHSQLIKIRFYGRLLDSRRTAYWCTAMPMIVLDPLPNEILESLWNSIVAPESNFDELRVRFSSTSAKLRLIQYVAAARLGEVWLQSISTALSTHISPSSTPRLINFLFSPQVAMSVQTLSQSKRRVFERAQAQVKSVKNITPEPTQTTYKGKDLWSIQLRLTEPFLDFYESKELVARDLAKSLGRKAFDNQDYKSVMNRLRTGLSLPQLRRIVEDANPSIDIAQVVSLYIDLAIDRGIVVPITVDKDGLTFRAYRHGEDVKFADAEARLCCSMLTAFASSLGRDELEHLWVEKLFVLFLKIGIRKRILTPWNGALGEDETVGVRYSLKGAVVQEGSTRLYAYNPEGGLTNVFLRQGYLQNEKGLYRVADIPTAPVRESAETDATLMGSLFGQLFRNRSRGRGDSLSNSDLTLLATCLYPNDAAAALASSVDIFSRNWKWKNKAASYYGPSLSAREAEMLFSELRSHVCFEAARSGLWKFESFNAEVPWEIIHRVALSLQDPIYRDVWRSFWPAIGKQTPRAIAPSLRNVLARLGSWCAQACSLLSLLDVSLLYRCSSDTGVFNKRGQIAHSGLKRSLRESSRYRKVLKTYGGTEGAMLAVKIGSALRDVKNSSLNPDDLRKFALESIDLLIKRARPLLDLVDSIVTRYGRPKTVTQYPHALFVDLRPFMRSRESYQTEVDKVVESIQIRAKRSSTRGRARIDAIPAHQGGFRSGRWICSSGSMSRAWLIRLARELCKQLPPEAGLKMVLLAHLADECQPMRAENTNTYRGQYFWQFAHSIVDRLSAKSLGHHLFSVTLQNAGNQKALENEILGEKPGAFNAIGNPRVMRLDKPLAQSLTSQEYSYVSNDELVPSRLFEISKEDNERRDIGIITVVTEETRAVVEKLSELTGYRKVRERSGKRIFYEGMLQGQNSNAHTVVCTQQIEQGNRPIITAYQALSRQYSPRLIVLLGIAGAVHPDIDLCDVLIVTQVIYYEKRKVSRPKTKIRGESYKIPAWLRPTINDFFVKNREPSFFPASKGSFKTEFKVMQGPLGSGEAVIGYRDARERKWLAEFNDQTKALETEAGGLAQAFYEHELEDGDQTRGYLVLRGISDHADKEKNDRWRQPAADNAVIALQEILKTLEPLSTLFPEKH